MLDYIEIQKLDDFFSEIKCIALYSHLIPLYFENFKDILSLFYFYN